MKKYAYLLLLLLVASFSFQACSSRKTYAEQLADERRAISKFVKERGITLISEEEFKENNFTTDLAKNEYVQFKSGVCMQILDPGGHENPADTFKTQDDVLVRYVEYGIMEEDTTLSNIYDPHFVDRFTYQYDKKMGASGRFKYGTMMKAFESTVVPAGWLVPLEYVKDMGKVNLIVPSKQGHTYASRYVHPYFYEIRKYQKY